MLDSTIHNRALSTVARITFTLGAVGCVEVADDEPTQVVLDDQADGQTAPPREEVVNNEDAYKVEQDAFVDDAQDVGSFAEEDALAADAELPEPDAFEADPDAAFEDPDAAEMLADAGSEPEANCTTVMSDPELWAECCEAVGWDFEVPGCMAWGPPVPPRMVARNARPKAGVA